MAIVTDSKSQIATDPLRNFRFEVIIADTGIDGLATMGFMSVSGLSVNTEVIPYREGGMNTTTQKMPGQSDFSPITLSRGLILGGGQQMEWMKQIFSVVQGEGNGGANGDFRTDIVINVKNHPSTTADPVTKASFKIYNAWPTSVAFSDLDAGANAIIVNQMTLAHEGFEVQVAGTGAGDSVGF